jgi:hypothetical protein
MNARSDPGGNNQGESTQTAMAWRGFARENSVITPRAKHHFFFLFFSFNQLLQQKSKPKPLRYIGPFGPWERRSPPRRGVLLKTVETGDQNPIWPPKARIL